MVAQMKNLESKSHPTRTHCILDGTPRARMKKLPDSSIAVNDLMEMYEIDTGRCIDSPIRRIAREVTKARAREA